MRKGWTVYYQTHLSGLGAWPGREEFFTNKDFMGWAMNVGSRRTRRMLGRKVDTCNSPTSHLRMGLRL